MRACPSREFSLSNSMRQRTGEYSPAPRPRVDPVEPRGHMTQASVQELTGVLHEVHHREQGDVGKTETIAGNVIAPGDEAIEPSQAALCRAFQIVRCVRDAVHTRLERFVAFA